ncbi:MAG: DUF3261 domain-containing protein [Myxococcales bacterium]|nr:DUF3261 domain-containing protein [Myxococcales bacterium]
MKPVVLLAICTLLSACSGQPARPTKLTPDSYPWTLRQPHAFGKDFLWQQRLTARTGRREDSLTVALQKRGNVVTLVGLTPFNTKAFVLQQDGDVVTFEALVNREMPFPPRFILIDIQRTYLPLPSDATTPHDGVQTLELAGERVQQTFVGGQLSERRFERLDGKPAGTLRIRYQGWWPNGATRKILLDNAWFGYSLVIETQSAVDL